MVEAISGRTSRFKDVLDEVMSVLRELPEPPVHPDGVVEVSIRLRLERASTGVPCNRTRDAMKSVLGRLAGADVPDAAAREALEADEGELHALQRRWAREMAESAKLLLAALFSVDDEDDLPTDAGRRWLLRYAEWLDRQDTGGCEVIAAARETAADLRALVAEEDPSAPATSCLLMLLGTVDVLARLIWIATVRDWWLGELEQRRKGQEERDERRAMWRSPSLPLPLSRHIADPPREARDLVSPSADGWSLAPSLPAPALRLEPLSRSAGRALLRRLPSVARAAAIDPTGPVVLWQDGRRRVTAEALASQATLLRIEATRSVEQTLRQWLGLAHDAEPWAALETLSCLPLRWTGDDNDQRADALVSLVGALVVDVRRYRDGRAECSLSAALHPAVAARLRAAVLVPCLPRLPPTWNSKAAELCDRLDHRMMRELAIRPHGGTAAGAPLDVEALVLHQAQIRPQRPWCT